MTKSHDLEKISEIIKQSNIEIKSIQVEKEVPLSIDAGNLLAIDTNELDKDKLLKPDDYFKDLARDGVQCIINDIWELPTETIENTLYAVLPKPSTRTPREKPLPKDKPLTKWQTYAKEKGVIKKRKGGKVWDEILKEWIPRYGYLKAAAEKKKNWVMEVPGNANPYEDQFAKASNAKKERIAQNEYKRLRNIAKTKNVKVPHVGTTSESLKTPSRLVGVLEQTRLSTASLGKFQKQLPEDRPIGSVVKGKKRKLPVNDTSEMGMINEKKRSLDILEKLGRPNLDYESAVNKQVKIDNIEEAQSRGKDLSKRRSKRGGRQRGKSEKRAFAKGLKPTGKALKAKKGVKSAPTSAGGKKGKGAGAARGKKGSRKGKGGNKNKSKR